MIPMGNETVMLVQRTEEAGEDGRTRVRYVKHRLTGCSWQRTEVRTLSGNDVQRGEVTVCRIPADQQRPRAGDSLFLGEVTEPCETAAQLNAALEAHQEAGAFIVTAVRDNARGGFPLPHYKATGEA